MISQIYFYEPSIISNQHPYISTKTLITDTNLLNSDFDTYIHTYTLFEKEDTSTQPIRDTF